MVELNKEIYIGVGANLGDRLENIRRALNELASSNIRVVRTASIYETIPWGFDADTTFYNTVFHCFTSLNPMDLLTTLKIVEKKLGRQKKNNSGYESRTIDLDILLYNDEIFNNDQLTIPHPYLLERQFVTFPLSELTGEQFFNSLNQRIPAILKSKNEDDIPFVVNKPLLINE